MPACPSVMWLVTSHLGIFCSFTSIDFFNIVSVCLSFLRLVASHLGLLYLPISHKKDVRLIWISVLEKEILCVSGISQQDYRAAVINEQGLNFVCTDC